MRVIPGDALGKVYAGGVAEYHVRPEHFYLDRDVFSQRRNSLSRSLYPTNLYEKYRNDYVLKLIIPTCTGNVQCCQKPGPESQCDGNWTLQTIQAVFTRRAGGLRP